MVSRNTRRIAIFAILVTIGCRKDPPKVQFTATSDPTNPLVMSFNAAESRAAKGLEIALYEWNYGDGSTETFPDDSKTPPNPKTPQPPPHTYRERGHYYVTLTVMDDDLATSVGGPPTLFGVTQTPVSYVVVGNSRPVARLAATPTIAARGQEVTFDRSASTDADGTIQGWQLTYNDGKGPSKIEDAKQPSIGRRFETLGPHTVTLIVWDNDGEASGEVPVTVEVKEALECTVEIVSPRSGTTVPRKPDVAIEVSTGGDLPVTAVDFYVDHSGPHRQMSRPFTFRWDTSDPSKVASGSHPIEVQGLVIGQNILSRRLL